MAGLRVGTGNALNREEFSKFDSLKSLSIFVEGDADDDVGGSCLIIIIQAELDLHGVFTKSLRVTLDSQRGGGSGSIGDDDLPFP